jgi:hypothetical protein
MLSYCLSIGYVFWQANKLNELFFLANDKPQTF